MFSSQLIHGITAKIRYKNLFYETYRDLFNHINIYRKNLTKLTEEYDVICQEIKLFYQKNDINMIIQFFKNLDTPNNSPLSSQVDTSDNHIDLEKKLRIVPPVPAEEQLPEIPPIPQLKKIKSDLSQLLNRSFSSQANGDPRHFQL